jgi:hypothetical protein
MNRVSNRPIVENEVRTINKFTTALLHFNKFIMTEIKINNILYILDLVNAI